MVDGVLPSFPRAAWECSQGALRRALRRESRSASVYTGRSAWERGSREARASSSRFPSGTLGISVTFYSRYQTKLYRSHAPAWERICNAPALPNATPERHYCIPTPERGNDTITTTI